MWRIIQSPLVRISFGLTMLTVSMLLVTDLLGLIPNTKNAELQYRKAIAESLAVQLSTQIRDRQLHSVEETLNSMVERNKTILSTALRVQGEKLIYDSGDHEEYWTLKSGDNSTATQVQVPLYNQDGLWGSVEISFTELSGAEGWMSSSNSLFAVALFMALVGFLAYLIFLKRTMRELNPDAVIPERVRTALNTLSEGLLIVDHNGFIVFSNQSFARKTGLTEKQLVGKKSTGLDWEVDFNEDVSSELPWVRMLAGEVCPKGLRVKLKTSSNVTYTFTVNVSPIYNTTEKIRGALVTFDDITEIETKNDELRRTLVKLEKSQREISRRNQELQVLATRDPLTGALNRRSLFQGFKTLLTEALDEGDELSCIMVDIDHFKSVNDRFGHAVGDKVIKCLAKILTDNSRPNDLVGRFGGEEFCVVLPGTDIDSAATIAERMRLAIQEGDGINFTNALRITSSFGVAVSCKEAQHHDEILEMSDKALYAAKEGGRNRVVKWTYALADDIQNEKIDSLVEPQEPNLDGAVSDNSEKFVEGVSKYEQDQANASQVHDDKVIRLYPQEQEQQNIPQYKDIELLDPLVSPDNIIQPDNMLLIDRIDQAIRRAESFRTQVAVMVVDVDVLQRVNDTLSLSANDKLSKTIIARYKQVLRRTDTVAMNGESELLFSVSLLGRSQVVVLLSDLKQTEIVTTILQRIFSAQNEPVDVEGNEFFLNSSVGVSLYPHDGEDPEILIRKASSAMKEAKKSPVRKKYRFYSDDINQRSKRQIRLEAELHRALEREELTINYQPKVDLKTGSILGMEALLRWMHPQFGLVPPNDFIPIAEQTGLIEEISQWVINGVCQQILFWQKAGFGIINIAINLSPVEFRNSDLGNQIIKLVGDYEIPASAIEIEVTETVVMQNMDTAVNILESLNDAGFCISVDDFGTGYSSLSYLKRFPLSKVKIDRSFISDFTKGASDAAIVSAIIAMSHSLGLRVVAEGVETEEQLRFLQDLQCDEIQGYLISKPVPAEDASDFLAQSSSIQRMIKDYGVQYAELAAYQGSGAACGMIGILNEFPVNSVESRT